jgi:hypothetical protein
MTYYVGGEVSQSDLLGEGNPRYFYALRRTDDGTLYFAKIDQLKDTGTIVINTPGASTEDFTDFEYGVDFFDGRLADDHSRPYDNLYWDQYRWDNKNIFYYLDPQGNFVVRVNQGYTYDPTQIIS